MATRPKTLAVSKDNAKNKLGTICEQLDAFDFSVITSISDNFKTAELTEEKINEIAEKFPTGEDENDYIYTFKVTGGSTNTSALIKQFEAKKLQQSSSVDDNKDLCKINTNFSTQYFYVGRSQKIRTRIRQHLGDNYKGTYALHMIRWCTTVNANIEITCYTLENQDNLFVQTIEDALWDKLRPCFGKKGDK
jgi:hypothetical protein